MATITHIPPSIPIILKRIEHYEALTENSTCDSQHACFSLVLAELDLLIEELIKDTQWNTRTNQMITYHR